MLIGDSLRDIGAARGFGIWAYGVRTGAGCRDGQRYRREIGTPPVPDLMFETVSEAVDFELEYLRTCNPDRRIHPTFDGRETTRQYWSACADARGQEKRRSAHAIVRALTEDETTCLRFGLTIGSCQQLSARQIATAEVRNRVEAMPSVVQALRAGERVRAPGYDAATRGVGPAVTYDPAGQSVIVLEGIFAGHPSLRSMLDFVVFAEVPETLQRARFSAFYRWKGLDQEAIEVLWRERAADEWPAVDAQRGSADYVVIPGTSHS